MILRYILLILLGLPLYGQAQCFFHKLYNSDNGFDEGQAVLQDFDNNFVTTGYALEGSSGLLLVVKTNSCGDTLWTRKVDHGIAGGFIGRSIIQNSDTSYLICGQIFDSGEGATDGFLYSLSTDGDSLWYVNHDIGYNDRLVDIKSVSDGGYIIAGHRNETDDSTIFLLRVNEVGNEIWHEFYGSSDYENVESVDETSTGDFVLFGDVISSVSGTSDFQLIKADHDGNQIWLYQYDSQAGLYEGGGYGVITNDGGYIMVGGKEQSSGGNSEAWIVKTDINGIEEWSKEWDLPISTNYLLDVQQNEDGTFVASGNVDYGAGPDPAGWLVKFDSIGDTIWTREYSYYGTDDSHTYPNGIAIASDGGYIVTGYIINSSLPAMNDLWLLKTDSLGYSCAIVDTTQGCSSLDCSFITADFTIQDTAIMINDTAWVTATYNGLGTVTHWGFDVQYASSDNSFTFPYTIAGDYQVQLVVTGPDGFCTDTVYQDIYIDTTTGVSEYGSPNSLKVFPNPTTGNVSFFSTEKGHVRIYDLTGEKVHQFALEETNYTFDASSLNAGIYLVRFTSSNGSSSIANLVVNTGF